MATKSPRRAAATPAAVAAPGVHFRVECADLHARLFEVTLTIDRPRPSSS